MKSFLKVRVCSKAFVVRRRSGTEMASRYPKGNTGGTGGYLYTQQFQCIQDSSQSFLEVNGEDHKLCDTS